MPIHDWTRVEAGDFHDFHQVWIGAIRNALNTGGLPKGYYAMAEQVLGGPIPGVIALHRSAEPDIYAARADRIAIRHRHGEVVAIIEIVSPGNKDSRHALRAFVEKCRELLDRGIHLLIVDLFPPSPRDPSGIHKAIWDEVMEEPYEPPPNKPLTVAAYIGGPLKSAYVDPVAVGDPLPPLPIFLSPETYVPAPLEPTYAATWHACPAPIRELLEPPGECA